MNKRMSSGQIVSELRDGMTLGIGGWGARRKPMALVREILRSPLKDLTVVSYGGPDVGLLCAAGKIRKLVLELAEKRMQENGMNVLWAQGAAEACQQVLNIANKHKLKKAIKSKSMVTEEIGLNHVLENAGIKVVETDLGEYIIQLRGEPPAHIMTPAVHLTRLQVAQTFEVLLCGGDDGLVLGRDGPHLYRDGRPISEREALLESRTVVTATTSVHDARAR